MKRRRSREIAFSIARSPIGACSMCCRTARAVIACALVGGAQFYGFCPRCVAGMARVARVVKRAARPRKGA